jgi:tetratricopeptide (TPR) repeat protein
MKRIFRHFALCAALIAMSASVPRALAESSVLEAAEERLSENPRDVDALIAKGRALEKLDRVDAARAVFDELVESADARTRSLYERGLFRYRQGRFAGAIEDLTAASIASDVSPEMLLRLGDAHYAAGDPSAAFSAYRQATIYPDASSAALRRMGNAAYARRDFSSALAAYSEALRRNPADGYAVYYRAWTYQATGRWTESLADLDLAVELLGGTEPRVFNDRGRLLRLINAPALALHDFETAADLTAEKPQSPTHLAALLGALRSSNDLGQPTDATKRLEALKKAVQDDSAVHIEMALSYESGRIALLRKHYESAEAVYTKLIEAMPWNPDVFANRAIARLGRDDVAGALADWRRATERNPADAGLWYGFARASIAAGARGEALRAAAYAEQHADGDLRAAVERGRMLLAMDSPFAALISLNRRLAVDPNSVEAQRLKALALRELGRNHEALNAISDLLALAPQSPAARLLEADVRIALGDAVGARLALNEANVLGANAAEVAALAGETWMTAARIAKGESRRKAYAQAIRGFDLAVTLSDNAPAVLARRAAAYERVGRLADARHDLDKAIGAKPQDAELRFARASVLKALDECALAIRDFDAGLSLRPENDLARAARSSCKLAEGAVFDAIADYIGSIF